MACSTLEVRRDRLADARIAEEAVPVPSDGQAVLRVQRFGLSANVITYAQVGDALGYWGFFPAGETGWGRIPAWGFAEVVASATDALPDGQRLFGLVPMSSHMVVTPRPSEAGIVDSAPHRAKLPGAYNAYRLTGDANPREGRELLLRPLFMLCFLLADLLEERDLYGAEQVLLLSASSKTAIGLAHELGARGTEVVGLTSARNERFVRDLGVYAGVATYAGLPELDPSVATVAVDLAGGAGLRRRVHEHFGASLRHSALVGATHGDRDAFAVDPELPGPQPVFFFVPDRLRTRTRDWGQAGLDERVDAAFQRFVTATESWMTVVDGAGPSAVLSTYHSVLAGTTRPDLGHALTLGAS